MSEYRRAVRRVKEYRSSLYSCTHSNKICLAMDEKFRILFVTTSDLSGSSGHNVATAEIVAAFGRNESILTAVVCPEPAEDLPRKVSETVDTFYHFEDTDASILGHAKVQLRLAPVLRRAMKMEKPGVIVARHSPSSITPPLLTRAYGRPYFLLVRGLSHEKLRFSSILKRFFWLNVRLADRVYVAYEEIKERTQRIRKASQTEAECFPNAVDPEGFSPISVGKARERLELGFNDEDFVVGFVGSLKDRHLIDQLLLGVKKVDGVGVLIVGDGPARGKLEELVRTENVENKVVFAGKVKHSEVDRYISACDIMYGVVHPDIPSNPIKCYEYLATGRPVITSHKREFEFVERIGAGRTIETEDPQTIEEAIREMKSSGRNELLEMGERGREYVLENHTWDELPKMILEDLKDYVDI